MRRRSFLKLLAGAAAITAVPASALTGSTPIIYGDGIHDDVEAIEAFLRGMTVEFADPKVAAGARASGGIFALRRGVFNLSRGIDIGEWFSGCTLEDTTLILRSGSGGILNVKDAHSATVRHCRLILDRSGKAGRHLDTATTYSHDEAGNYHVTTTPTGVLFGQHYLHVDAHYDGANLPEDYQLKEGDVFVVQFEPAKAIEMGAE